MSLQYMNMKISDDYRKVYLFTLISFQFASFLCWLPFHSHRQSSPETKYITTLIIRSPVKFIHMGKNQLRKFLDLPNATIKTQVGHTHKLICTKSEITKSRVA